MFYTGFSNIYFMSQTREIKFRAWDQISKIMIDRYEYLLSLIGFQTALLESCGERYDHLLEQSGVLRNVFILMQYTGLKDKNGVEIYENDILKHHGIVAWDDDNHRWAAIDLNWNDNREWHCIDYLTSPFEVIGNTYANPELLNN